MRVFGRILGWSTALVAVTLLLLLAGGYFLLQTQRGQDLVLREGLKRVQDRIHGELVVDGISAPSLLRGVTLRGVRLDGAGGRPVLRVDSLQIDYSLWGLLRRDLVLSRVEAWNPRLYVERLHGEDLMNVQRLVAPPRPSPDTVPVREPDTEPEIVLRRVGIHGGEVQLRLPVGEGDPAPPPDLQEVDPGGEGTVRLYRFSEIEGRFPEIRIRPGEEGGEVVRIADLALEGRVLEDPFRITGLRGILDRTGEGADLMVHSLRLPGSELRGRVGLNWTEDADPFLEARLQSLALDLEDLRWIDDRLPVGEGEGILNVAMGPNGTRWDFVDFALRVPGSELRAGGGMDLGPDYTPEAFRNLHLETSPLALSLLDPWIEEELPVRGSLRGSADLNGPLSRLDLRGDMTLEEEGREAVRMGLRVEGVVHLLEERGVTDLRARLDPFRYELVGELAPDFVLEGPGVIDVEASGRLSDGLAVSAVAEHRPLDLPPSRITTRGTVRRDPAGEWDLELDGELDPVSLTAVGSFYPELALSGAVEGSYRIRGPFRDLEAEADLLTPEGSVVLRGRTDIRDPGAGYSVEGTVGDLRLSRLFPDLPDPTTVTGSFLASGRGLDRRTVEGSARVDLRRSEVGRLVVDSVGVSAQAGDGVVHLDTLWVESNLTRIGGSGSFGLMGEGTDGEVRLEFENDSLASLRPLFLGEEVIAQDTLSPLEREVLSMRGMDPDTLPAAEAVAMDGRMRGWAVLRGSMESFGGEGEVQVEEFTYGESLLRNGRVDLRGSGFPGDDAELEAVITADSIRAGAFGFEAGRAEVRLQEPRAGLSLHLVRHGAEEYRISGVVEREEEGGGSARLDELLLRFDTVSWELDRPARARWTEDAVTIQDFLLLRPGAEEMRLAAEGTLPFRGPADFKLDVDGLNLARLTQLAQMDEGMDGILDLSVGVTGRAEAPLMNARVSVDGLSYQELILDRLEGDLEYSSRRIRGDLEAWRGEQSVATIRGAVPADLSFTAVERRIPPEELDLTVVADSLPASLLAGLMEALDDVEGTLSGSLHVGGTPDEVRPSGSFRFRDGGVTLPELGVRYRGITGALALSRDGTVRVDGQAHSRGTARVDGTVTLDPATNPTFDLRIRASGFQAVDRRDFGGRLGGEMRLTGTFERPLIQGELTVDQGVLWLEEFERAAEVVDLTDPAFFDVVDITLGEVRTVLDETQNPFLQNLRMEVDLRVERDTWLRSRDMNVEMGGDLLVTWDRTLGDPVLVGTLRAVRGSYTAFGRQFQVQEGTVEFVGTPGMNPNLNIQAVNRLRTPEGEPLNIIAAVSGTLLSPRVNLQSDAQPPIAESDLVSYLIFGRPSYALGQGQSAIVAGAAGSLLGAATEAGLTLGFGTVAQQLGSVVARDVGLDYFAITQAPGAGLGGGAGFGGTMAATQVEAGWYAMQNVFVALLLRPLSGLGSSSQNQFAGVRLEWRISDLWSVEGFVEDRFSREQISGFGEIGYRLSKVGGFFVFREWSY